MTKEEQAAAEAARLIAEYCQRYGVRTVGELPEEAYAELLEAARRLEAR